MSRFDRWRLVEHKQVVKHPTDGACSERGRVWTVVRTHPVVAAGVVEPFGEVRCAGCCMALETHSAVMRGLCCAMHNRHCEPPSELCCRDCSEVLHPVHLHGARCVWLEDVDLEVDGV